MAENKMVAGLTHKFWGGLLRGKRSWKQNSESFIRADLGWMGVPSDACSSTLLPPYISPAGMVPCGQENDSAWVTGMCQPHLLYM